MRIPTVEALKCSNTRREFTAKDYQSRQDGNIVSMIKSVNRKWLCMAGLGEISGDGFK